MSILKKPDLSDPKLRAKLAKGMGHNYYGEPAWPNDLLYIFPVCILGTFACCIGLAVMAPTQLGEPADPFNTPLEILPECLKIISKLLPLVHIFEEMRNILIYDIVKYGQIFKAIFISFLYFIFAVTVFYWSYNGAKNRGTLINMGE